MSGDDLIQQIQHLNSAGTPGVISQFDYTYRQDRNIETWTTQQNGAVAKKWTFGYDDALRLQSAVRTDTSTQAILEQFGYGYDKAGNRTSVTEGTTTTNYPANELNQATAEQGFGATKFSGTIDEPALVTVNSEPAKVMSTGGNAPYTYEALVDLAEGSNTVTIEATDGNGNVATQSYSVTVGGVQMQLEYDLNGNLRYEKDATGTILREFQWDSKNRLLKVIDGTQESEFVYDGFDRRVRIVETDNSVQQSNHVYIWNGSQIAQKRASNGSTVERSYFIQGFEAGGNDYFYTRDHLGSVREVVASDGATVEAVYDYSPWGEVSKIAGTGTESDFLYTGHFYHAPSDLHLALYRAYNPTLGIWLSRDPIAENGGINLYAYAANNPINFYDILGMSPGAGLNFASERYSDLVVSMGDFDGAGAALNKASTIINKQDNMAKELLKESKKPGFLKKSLDFCKRNARSLKKWFSSTGAGIRPKPPNPLDELLSERGAEAQRGLMELRNRGLRERQELIANPNSERAWQSYERATE